MVQPSCLRVWELIIDVNGSSAAVDCVEVICLGIN